MAQVETKVTISMGRERRNRLWKPNNVTFGKEGVLLLGKMCFNKWTSFTNSSNT